MSLSADLRVGPGRSGPHPWWFLARPEGGWSARRRARRQGCAAVLIGTTIHLFRAQKGIDDAGVNANNRALGRAGEYLVLHYERETLMRKGRPDLAQRVRHVAKIEEVKTTRGSAETASFLSANELLSHASKAPTTTCIDSMVIIARRNRGGVISRGESWILM